MRLFFALLSAIVVGQVSARTVVMSDLHQLEPFVEKLRKRYAPEEILLVYDYDHTIAQSLGLGGEAWFRWQLERLKKPEQRQQLMKAVLDILYVQSFLLERSLTELVQPEKPQILNRLQATGVKSMIVTARTPIFRDITFADLKRFGIGFEQHSIAPHSYEKNYLPYTNDTLSAQGLPEDAVQRYGLFKEPRYIRYERGVLFTSGQNKGVMLRTFFNKTGYTPKAVVFVDDSLHHVRRMEEAFANTGIELFSMHYNRSPADAVVVSPEMYQIWQAQFDAMLPELTAWMATVCFRHLGELSQQIDTAY